MDGMRVLLTGGTKRQVGVEDPLYDLINIPHHMYDTMVGMGDIVDWRIYNPRSTERYDVRLVSIAPLGVAHSTYAMESYLALTTDDRCLLYFDDYQLDLVIAGAVMFLAKPEWAMTMHHIVQGEDLQHLQYVCACLASGDWPDNWTALIPAYAWGDKSVVARLLKIDPKRLAWVDPTFTAMDQTHVTTETGPKAEAWFLPSLNNHREWINRVLGRWPVHTVGSYKQGIRLQSEADVAQRYASYIGALAPPYPQSGSGWFRSRYVYAFRAGTILVGDPTDGLGPAYALTVDEVEAMDNAGLVLAYRDQRAAIYSFFHPYMGSKALFASQLLQALEGR